MKNRKKNSENECTSTDTIIDNLKTTKQQSLNGDFIMDQDDTGSYRCVNTPICGIEVDVDEL